MKNYYGDDNNNNDNNKTDTRILQCFLIICPWNCFGFIR
jgi:hypothetical protein